MKKIIYFSIITIISYQAFSDSDPNIENTNSQYISASAYIQNPYIGQPSFGGTQNIEESQIISQNVAEKWFLDGTWNVMGSASYVDLNGANSYSYGANIFGQTGTVAGFSFGGDLLILNPFYANQLNPATPNLQYQILPVAQQVAISELYTEYRYTNVVQADLGYISITNSPWLATNYYPNYLTGITYQGILLNINAGNGWLLTGLAFNQAQLIGETGFSGLTMYNQKFDYGTGTANINNSTSFGTEAVGANFIGDNTNYNLRLWAYNFENYANMLYFDNSLKLNASNDLSFNLAFQAGTENGNSNNIISINNDGQITSNFIGAEIGLNYNWFGLTLGYNGIWGPANAYEGGGIVSPYTYQLGVDPLYTTSWIIGMVEKSAGNAYKIAPSLSFLNNNLTISPSIVYYDTYAVVSSTEYDFIINYNIPQIKGFNLNIS